MSQFQPPPTWALPVLVDEQSGKAQFSPVWLKWFVDLTQLLDNAGVQAGGSIIHNGLTGLQGGTPGQYYHLTYAEYSTLSLNTAFYSATAFTAQTEVTVTHNFGKYPLVSIINAAGVVLALLLLSSLVAITHTSINAFTVTFSVATTGTIIASA